MDKIQILYSFVRDLYIVNPSKAINIRIGPRKLRLLSKNLRGLSPQKALEKLKFYPQKGVTCLEKVIKQAKANAINNFKLSEGSLIIKSIQVNEGTRIKRLDKSHGARFDRGIIKKRSSHIYLILEDKSVKEMKKEVKSGTKG